MSFPDCTHSEAHTLVKMKSPVPHIIKDIGNARNPGNGTTPWSRIIEKAAVISIPCPRVMAAIIILFDAMSFNIASKTLIEAYIPRDLKGLKRRTPFLQLSRNQFMPHVIVVFPYRFIRITYFKST